MSVAWSFLPSPAAVVISLTMSLWFVKTKVDKTRILAKSMASGFFLMLKHGL